MVWLYLGGAIACEVFGTLCLKLSDGFTRGLPSLGVVAGYAGAFGLLALCLRTMAVGTAYAIWAGLGTAAIAVAGVVLFDEPMGWGRALGLALVIAGVLVLNLTTAS